MQISVRFMESLLIFHPSKNIESLFIFIMIAILTNLILLSKSLQIQFKSIFKIVAKYAVHNRLAYNNMHIHYLL